MNGYTLGYISLDESSIMLKIIHNDHVNMSLLLKLLRKNIRLLEADEKVDYRLIKAIITYLRQYADQYHHPMEDLIYDYYIKYRDVPDEIINRLSQEHQTIKKVTIEFDELLDIILLDAIVPKDLFIVKLQEFVDLQSSHLNYEEKEILPLIEKSLTADDWKNLEQQWQHKDYMDPLFGSNVTTQYSALAKHIKEE
ncbi:hemerythrin domain-containing protein [Psychromonas sp. MME1]|uniref:hemerythrin domain-containing protein n=1 Tax=Psychromonas sp. MME1 TaxID=3231032 RepID=UPI0034E1C06D